jgi:hypothetical protein
VYEYVNNILAISGITKKQKKTNEIIIFFNIFCLESFLGLKQLQTVGVILGPK